MSNLPEISIEKYAARWKAKAISLQDELFKVECLAEGILEERDEARQKAAELESRVAELEKTSTPIDGDSE